jgi:hypothetical protein
MRNTSPRRRAASPFVGPIVVGSVSKRAPGSTRAKGPKPARPDQLAELERLREYVWHDYDPATITSQLAQRYIYAAKSFKAQARKDKMKAAKG